MQKEGEEKLAQKLLQFMVLKSTLLSIYIHTSNSITLKLLILTMKRSTKLTARVSLFSPWNILGLPSSQVHTYSQLLTFHLLINVQTPCRPKGLTAVKPYYTFAVHRTGLPEVKTIFQRRHFCPCPQCTTGDFHRCMYTDFLGMSLFYKPVFFFTNAFQLIYDSSGSLCYFFHRPVARGKHGNKLCAGESQGSSAS